MGDVIPVDFGVAAGLRELQAGAEAIAQRTPQESNALALAEDLSCIAMILAGEVKRWPTVTFINGHYAVFVDGQQIATILDRAYKDDELERVLIQIANNLI